MDSLAEVTSSEFDQVILEVSKEPDGLEMWLGLSSFIEHLLQPVIQHTLEMQTARRGSDKQAIIIQFDRRCESTVEEQIACRDGEGGDKDMSEKVSGTWEAV